MYIHFLVTKVFTVLTLASAVALCCCGCKSASHAASETEAAMQAVSGSSRIITLERLESYLLSGQTVFDGLHLELMADSSNQVVVSLRAQRASVSSIVESSAVGWRMDSTETRRRHETSLVENSVSEAKIEGTGLQTGMIAVFIFAVSICAAYFFIKRGK